MARLIFNSGPGTIERPETIDSTTPEQQPDWLVIVFDNEFNTFEEVTMILILATNCSVEEATIETWEVHHLGKSVVHRADEKECLRVASIIAKIGIRVEVEPQP